MSRSTESVKAGAESFVMVLRTGRLYEYDLVADALREAELPFVSSEDSAEGLSFAMPADPVPSPGKWWSHPRSGGCRRRRPRDPGDPPHRGHHEPGLLSLRRSGLASQARANDRRRRPDRRWHRDPATSHERAGLIERPRLGLRSHPRQDPVLSPGRSRGRRPARSRRFAPGTEDHGGCPTRRCRAGRGPSLPSDRFGSVPARRSAVPFRVQGR